MNQTISHMIFLALNKLQNVEEIGQGAIGHVSKAIWRGSIVAAKEIRVVGKMLELLTGIQE